MNSLNKHFKKFLNTIECELTVDALIEAWMSKDNQKDTEKIINSKDKKAKKNNGTKKGKSAYIFWSVEELIRIKQQIQDGKIEKLDNQQIMGELANRWENAKKGDISK